MRKVLVLGCFDITHAGHIDLFDKASRLGDVLTVGIAHDALVSAFKGSNRPIFGLDERISIIRACRYVNSILVYGNEKSNRETNRADMIELVEIVNPDIFAEGEDSDVMPGYFEEKDILRFKLDRLSLTDICTEAYIRRAGKKPIVRKQQNPTNRSVEAFYFPAGAKDECHGD
jgi:cytidyltransferase-like protein